MPGAKGAAGKRPYKPLGTHSLIGFHVRPSVAKTWDAWWLCGRICPSSCWRLLESSSVPWPEAVESPAESLLLLSHGLGHLGSLCLISDCVLEWQSTLYLGLTLIQHNLISRSYSHSIHKDPDPKSGHLLSFWLDRSFGTAFPPHPSQLSFLGDLQEFTW